MYVIEDKKGLFYTAQEPLWVRDIIDAFHFRSQQVAHKVCDVKRGERVFEVELVLGKQVK